MMEWCRCRGEIRISSWLSAFCFKFRRSPQSLSSASVPRSFFAHLSSAFPKDPLFEAFTEQFARFLMDTSKGLGRKKNSKRAEAQQKTVSRPPRFSVDGNFQPEGTRHPSEAAAVRTVEHRLPVSVCSAPKVPSETGDLITFAFYCAKDLLLFFDHPPAELSEKQLMKNHSTA